MRQSFLFSKTRREGPKDEVSKNAQLLIRAGYIHKEMAGVYSLLPLGVRVINNLVEIVRKEMNSLGGQEISMTALQEPTIWRQTDRWDDEKVDNWFKTLLKNGTELGLGFTHEEPISSMLTDHIRSYKDLPLLTYQFQTKFRNELRAKSGLMRGREFLMKDLYSFSRTSEEDEKIYNKVKDVYISIFNIVGIGDVVYPTYASGGTFSKYSMEFQAITEAGEDEIYIDAKKKIAINKEIANKETEKEFGIDLSQMEIKKSVEVGNIFHLGTRYSEPLNLFFREEAGTDKPVVMSSYGIGIGRLMATIAEIKSDDKGLIWPKKVSPFDIHIIQAVQDEKAKEIADKLYEQKTKEGLSVLYDDRSVPAGEKFADADLIGIPVQIIVGRNAIEQGMVEIKDRQTGERIMEKI